MVAQEGSEQRKDMSDLGLRILPSTVRATHYTSHRGAAGRLVMMQLRDVGFSGQEVEAEVWRSG